MTTATWTAGFGDWNTASNWSTGTVPGPGDTAVIDHSGAYQVTVGTASVQSIILDSIGAQISATGSLSVASGLAINAGTLAIASQATVVTDTLSNAGSIVDNGRLRASISDPQAIAHMSGTGYLDATVNFSNFGTINLTPSTPGINWTGSMSNGTIEHMAGQVSGGELTLTDVTLEGSLEMRTGDQLLGPPAGGLSIVGTFTLLGANGTGPGTLIVDGPPRLAMTAGGLVLQGTAFDNAVIANSGYVYSYDAVLGSGGTIELIGGGDVTGSHLLNNGTVAGVYGITLGQGGTIETTQFENAGLVTTGSGSNGERIGLNLGQNTFNNLASGRLIADTRGAIISKANIVNDGTVITQGVSSSSDFWVGTIDNRAGGLFQAISSGKVTVGSIFGTPLLDNETGGTVEAGAGGTITVTGQGAIINDGTLHAAGGAIVIQTMLQGSGTVTLDNNGTVDIAGPANASESFDFTGAGTLLLEQPTFFASTINHLSPDDLIRLGVSATAISYTSNDLKMQIGGGQTFDLAITGPHTLSDFIIDTSTNATTIQVSCFARGTRILTPIGPVAVERLREGDLVTVYASDTPQPIVWIGQRTLDCRRHPDPTSVRPVLVVAGAFGDGLPKRDLYLSPDHAVFVDGVLIPIKYLINGDAIRQVRRHRVTYFHIELPMHAVVLAEGLPSESRVPSGDRSAFANEAVVALHPDFHTRAWEAHGCAPLMIAGPVVEAMRARLAAQPFIPPNVRPATMKRRSA